MTDILYASPFIAEGAGILLLAGVALLLQFKLKGKFSSAVTAIGFWSAVSAVVLAYFAYVFSIPGNDDWGLGRFYLAFWACLFFAACVVNVFLGYLFIDQSKDNK